MRHLERAMVYSVLMGAAVVAAPVHATVYTAIERGRSVCAGATTSSAQCPSLRQLVAETGTTEGSKCDDPKVWETLKDCLASRKRVLFKEDSKLPPTARAMRRGGERELLSVPPTFQEQVDRGKANALERFERSQNLDYQQRVQDFFNTPDVPR
jgi:hypothetical protein